MIYANSSSVSLQPANTKPEFLAIEDLFKSYRTPQGDRAIVLNGINLTIAETEYISIIGHSGCGKSTLLRIIAGFEKATSGSVRLEGREIQKPGANA